MAYKIHVLKPARRAINRLPESIRQRVGKAIESLADNPRPAGCVKLKGVDDLWRIRVGSYRVVYTIDDMKLIVLVVKLGDRKDIYRG